MTIKASSASVHVFLKVNYRFKCTCDYNRFFPLTDPDVFPYKTKAELKRPTANSECFTKADLHAMPELNPPSLMPAGNVGTPVSVFLQLIQSCRFPPRLIRKLGLTFPKTGSHRRYGNVPYHYNTPVVGASEESVFTSGGVEICGPGGVAPPKNRKKLRDGQPKNKDQSTREDSPAAGAEEEEEEEESGPDDVSHFFHSKKKVCEKESRWFLQRHSSTSLHDPVCVCVCVPGR